MLVLRFDFNYKCVVCRMKVQTSGSSLLSLNVCLDGISILETIFLALNCTGFGLYWCVILVNLRILMVYDYDRNSEAIDVMIFVMMGAIVISVYVIWLRRILLCL